MEQPPLRGPVALRRRVVRGELLVRRLVVVSLIVGQKWFVGTPGRWEMLERHMDVRVGGSERLKGRWAGGAVSTFDATYHDVIPNERLVYSYAMHLA